MNRKQLSHRRMIAAAFALCAPLAFAVPTLPVQSAATGPGDTPVSATRQAVAITAHALPWIFRFLPPFILSPYPVKATGTRMAVYHTRSGTHTDAWTPPRIRRMPLWYPWISTIEPHCSRPG